tara:strand:- start:275 stop:667 length:393 start_codon:yes stop_codon:yes gene_type:complete
MALVPTLTLTDTTTYSDDISFSLTDSLTVAAPAQALSLINATATGGNNIIVPASTAIAYIYVRHTGTTDGSTGTAQLVDVEFTTNEAVARLGAGEFLFMPIFHAGEDVGVQLQVAHASIVQCEYAYWTKG